MAMNYIPMYYHIYIYIIYLYISTYDYIYSEK